MRLTLGLGQDFNYKSFPKTQPQISTLPQQARSFDNRAPPSTRWRNKPQVQVFAFHTTIFWQREEGTSL